MVHAQKYDVGVTIASSVCSGHVQEDKVGAYNYAVGFNRLLAASHPIWHMDRQCHAIHVLLLPLCSG